MNILIRILIVIVSSVIILVILSFGSLYIFGNSYNKINAFISVLIGVIINKAIKFYEQENTKVPKEYYENSQDSVNNPEVLEKIIKKYSNNHQNDENVK